jgi:hypothetical protein
VRSTGDPVCSSEVSELHRYEYVVEKTCKYMSVVRALALSIAPGKTNTGRKLVQDLATSRYWRYGSLFGAQIMVYEALCLPLLDSDSWQ